VGWRLKEKNSKYRIWSTISDTYITDWLTRNEILIQLAEYKIIKAKEEAIDEYYRFPNMWSVNGKRNRDPIREQAYFDWQTKLRALSDNKYNTFVNKEYRRIMKELKS